MTVANPVNENIPVYNNQAQLDHNRYLNVLRQEFLARLDNPTIYERSSNDFDLIITLGTGAFGMVFLARDKTNFTYHAVKTIEKEKVVKTNTVKKLLTEKKVLQSVMFPFVINMEYTSKDNSYIYFFLPLELCGNLYSLLKKHEGFSEELATFYTAQMVLALEYLHHCNIVHRDLKPENILINETGYLKLCDFGLCKILKGRAWTLCGTPDYLAPEIILSKGYSYSVDWWAIGVLIFEMSAGYPPFYSSDVMKLYEQILTGHYKAPSTLSGECKSLLKHLLEKDPNKRYGSLKAGVLDIKSHAWFRETDWHLILYQKVIPPYLPERTDVNELTRCGGAGEVKLKSSPKCLFEEEFKNF